MGIILNYRSMLAEALGTETGIDNSEIDSLRDAFISTRADLLNRRESGDLPFWNLPLDSDMISSINRYVEEKREQFDDFVLLGIGGSALGPIAMHTALNHPQHNLLERNLRNGCRFFCPDNVDPDLVGGVLDVVDPAKTLFNVVSKSGGTAETVAQFMVVLDLLKKKLGNNWRNHLVLTTDPERGLLRRFAREEGVKAFPIDPGVGGRFSILTPVGLLPAAMTGIDVEALCAGAASVRERCFNAVLEQNPPAMIAALLYLAQTRKKLPIHVVFAYSNRLYPVADWFRQIWAESLGKRFDLEGKEVFTGPTPVKAIGATDQHSQVQLYVEGPRDKATLFLGVKQFNRKVGIPGGNLHADETSYLENTDMGQLLNAERRATAYALTKAQRPNMTLELDLIDPAHIGALLYLFEAATLYAGGYYHVNPLDQPGVEAGKLATYALMGRSGFEREREEIEAYYRTKTKQIKIDL